jgi:hypothetical protein
MGTASKKARMRGGKDLFARRAAVSAEKPAFAFDRTGG